MSLTGYLVRYSDDQFKILRLGPHVLTHDFVSKFTENTHFLPLLGAM